MRNHTFQNLGLALLFALVISLMLPAATVAETTGKTDDGFYYSIEGETAVINGYTGSETAVAIPADINGVPVTGIGGQAFMQSSLISVDIPEGITNIGFSAFSGCGNLASVTIPEGVVNIDGYAFENCISLTSVVIPASVIRIGYRAFFNCSNLVSVDIPSSVISIGAFGGATEDGFTYSIEGDKAVIDGYTGSETDITIPTEINGIPVKGIGEDPFGYYDFGSIILNRGSSDSFAASHLTSVVIPEGVTGIGNYTFDRCSSLTTVNIPEGVTNIGWFAFSHCSSLTSVTIPNSVTSIGNNAFYDCDSLESVIIGGGVTYIGDNTFSYNDKLTSVTIPVSVIDINYYAFIGSNSVTILGYTGSYAETFAREHSIPFVAIEGQADIVSEKHAKMADGIFAAGDSHNWSKNDAWTKEQQESFWSILTASWKASIQSIVDTVNSEYVSYGPETLGYPSEEIAANEGLRTAFGIAGWGFGIVEDEVLQTRSGKTFDLSQEEYPTLDDFYAEAYKEYKGDVVEYYRVELSMTIPNGVDVLGAAKKAFVNEWAAKDDSMNEQGVSNVQGTDKAPEQFAEESYQELRVGDSGQDVLDMKQRFYELGYFRTNQFNNRFTDSTADTVKLFEKNNGLKVDGIADAEMQTVLFSNSAVGK